MALGFSKYFSLLNYDEEDFFEVWPEISEIGQEVMEELSTKIDDSVTLIPGSRNDLVKYVKSGMFLLGFTEVDLGDDPDLYDGYMSSAVLKTRTMMNDIGEEVSIVDVVDKEFVRILQDIFETYNDARLSRIYQAIEKASKLATDKLPKPQPAVGPSQAVKKAQTDPRASEPIKVPTSSAEAGKQGIKPGINYPSNPSKAKKSILYSLAADGNKQLSANFKVSDFKCRDGSDVILINPALVEALEKIRAHFGKPVHINSGYRTPSHNRATKGAVQNSQHMYGNAADISIKGVTPLEIYLFAHPWVGGGLGLYPSKRNNFVHIDVRDLIGDKYARWWEGKDKGVPPPHGVTA